MEHRTFKVLSQNGPVKCQWRGKSGNRSKASPFSASFPRLLYPGTGTYRNNGIYYCQNKKTGNFTFSKIATTLALGSLIRFILEGSLDVTIIRLKRRDHYRFQYHTTIGIRDVNYGGHLGNDTLVSILHDARVRMLNVLGATELDLGDSETGIIMNELAVNYRAEGRLLENITVHSDIDGIKTASFKICHLVTRDEAVIAIAETGIVAYNYSENRISTLPQRFLEKLETIDGIVQT